MHLLFILTVSAALRAVGLVSLITGIQPLLVAKRFWARTSRQILRPTIRKIISTGFPLGSRHWWSYFSEEHQTFNLRIPCEFLAWCCAVCKSRKQFAGAFIVRRITVKFHLLPKHTPCVLTAVHELQVILTVFSKTALRQGVT